jgi:hypothetical protein
MASGNVGGSSSTRTVTRTTSSGDSLPTGGFTSISSGNDDGSNIVKTITRTIKTIRTGEPLPNGGLATFSVGNIGGGSGSTRTVTRTSQSSGGSLPTGGFTSITSGGDGGSTSTRTVTRTIKTHRLGGGSIPSGSFTTMIAGNSGGSSFGTSGGTGLVGAGSNDGLTKTITTKITRFNTRGSVGDEQTLIPQGNRLARWSGKEKEMSNVLLPTIDLSKGQPRSHSNGDSMTTSFVRTRSPDAFGLFRNVAPIRVRVPTFANLRRRN